MNLFAGTASRGVFLSTDSGTSWTAVNNGYANTRISSLYLSGTNLFAATCFTSRSNFGTSWCNTGLYCSTDDGMSWTATGLQTTAAVVALAECPDETGGTDLFAGTDDGFGFGGGLSLNR